MACDKHRQFHVARSIEIEVSISISDISVF